VCGECVAVTGPKGSVTVRIVDLCPECEPGHLDLSQQAFAQIADVSAGKVPITWKVVPCSVTGNVEYQIKDGSSQYWTAIQVRNSRLPVAKLEWMQSGAWTVRRVDRRLPRELQLLRRRERRRASELPGAHHFLDGGDARGHPASGATEHGRARQRSVLTYGAGPST
jgi:hypothetical protein